MQQRQVFNADLSCWYYLLGPEVGPVTEKTQLVRVWLCVRKLCTVCVYSYMTRDWRCPVWLITRQIWLLTASCSCCAWPSYRLTTTTKTASCSWRVETTGRLCVTMWGPVVEPSTSVSTGTSLTRGWVMRSVSCQLSLCVCDVRVIKTHLTSLTAWLSIVLCSDLIWIHLRIDWNLSITQFENWQIVLMLLLNFIIWKELVWSLSVS